MCETITYTRRCERCKTNFQALRPKAEYCDVCKKSNRCVDCNKSIPVESRRCKECHNKSRGVSETLYEKICRGCSKKVSLEKRYYYCDECSVKTCLVCQKTFRSLKGLTCSPLCSSLKNTDKVISPQIKLCSCGCRREVRSRNRNYAQGCRLRGNNYLQTYKTNTPRVGFKEGEDNIGKALEVRQKLSESVKASYNDDLRELRAKQMIEGNIDGFASRRIPDIQGNLYRSSLEADFSNFLITNNIDFQYEVSYKFIPNDKYFYKLVDFVVDDVLIEITGVAFDSWLQETIDKIRLLEASVSNRIIVLTYVDKLDSLECLSTDRVKVFSLSSITSEKQSFLKLLRGN